MNKMEFKTTYLKEVKQYIEDYKDSTGIVLSIKQAKEHFSKVEYKELLELNNGWKEY